MPFLNNGPWNSSLHPRDSRGEFRYNGGRHRRSALIPIQPGPKIVIPPHPPNADIDANMRRMRALEFLSPNGKYPAFYLLVRTNGPWGYKNQPSHGANPQYDAFGNLNYGAAGTAAGIDSYTLQNEADIGAHKRREQMEKARLVGFGTPNQVYPLTAIGLQIIIGSSKVFYTPINMEILTAMLQQLGGAALRQESQPVAIDATGLETSTASAHFVSRMQEGAQEVGEALGGGAHHQPASRWVPCSTGGRTTTSVRRAAAATVALGPTGPTVQALRRCRLRCRVGAWR